MPTAGPNNVARTNITKDFATITQPRNKTLTAQAGTAPNRSPLPKNPLPFFGRPLDFTPKCEKRHVRFASCNHVISHMRTVVRPCRPYGVICSRPVCKIIAAVQTVAEFSRNHWNAVQAALLDRLAIPRQRPTKIKSSDLLQNNHADSGWKSLDVGGKQQRVTIRH